MDRKIGLMFQKYWVKWLVYASACAFIHFLIIRIVVDTPYIIQFLSNVISVLRVDARNYSEDNLYAAQISSTFIMVTLVSFLSGSGENILWENSVRYSLVNPKVVNFISITVALIINTIFASVAFWGNKAEEYIVFFVISLVLLTIMTYKIIGAYFARDTLKAKIINDYEKMDDTEQKAVLDCLRDRSLHYIDEQELTLLEENIDFFKQTNRNLYMVEILDYLSKTNEELFWIYVKKYNCIDDKTVRETCEELCYRLVNERQNNELERNIIEELYGERQIDSDLEQLIGKFSDGSFVKEHILQLVSTLYPMAIGVTLQNIYSGYMWDTFNIDGDIKEKVGKKINIPYSELINTYHLPVELLITAIQKNDVYSVEFILEYMESLKSKFADMVRDYFKEKNNTLFAEIDKALENEKPKGLSEDEDSAYEYTCQRVLESYTGYLSFVEIDFLSKRDNEYLRNLLFSRAKYVVLTEGNVKRITRICMEKISI